MSEINLNGVSGSLGAGRSLNATAHPKTTNLNVPAAGSDSVEFSHLPDLSGVDKTVEDDFANLRTHLQESANSDLYPPLETIDKLAAMLAIDFNPEAK